MTTERTIYAVVFSNYDPPEVNSLWSDEADAEAKAEELGAPWHVSPMTLNEAEAVTDPLAEGAP